MNTRAASDCLHRLEQELKNAQKEDAALIADAQSTLSAGVVFLQTADLRAVLPGVRDETASGDELIVNKASSRRADEVSAAGGSHEDSPVVVSSSVSGRGATHPSIHRGGSGAATHSFGMIEQSTGEVFQHGAASGTVASRLQVRDHEHAQRARVAAREEVGRRVALLEQRIRDLSLSNGGASIASATSEVVPGTVDQSAYWPAEWDIPPRTGGAAAGEQQVLNQEQGAGDQGSTSSPSSTSTAPEQWNLAEMGSTNVNSAGSSGEEDVGTTVAPAEQDEEDHTGFAEEAASNDDAANFVAADDVTNFGSAARRHDAGATVSSLAEMSQPPPSGPSGKGQFGKGGKMPPPGKGKFGKGGKMPPPGKGKFGKLMGKMGKGGPFGKTGYPPPSYGKGKGGPPVLNNTAQLHQELGLSGVVGELTGKVFIEQMYAHSDKIGAEVGLPRCTRTRTTSGRR